MPSNNIGGETNYVNIVSSMKLIGPKDEIMQAGP
jgi:hypothetical protein